MINAEKKLEVHREPVKLTLGSKTSKKKTRSPQNKEFGRRISHKKLRKVGGAKINKEASRKV